MAFLGLFGFFVTAIGPHQDELSLWLAEQLVRSAPIPAASRRVQDPGAEIPQEVDECFARPFCRWKKLGNVWEMYEDDGHEHDY